MAAHIRPEVNPVWTTHDTFRNKMGDEVQLESLNGNKVVPPQPLAFSVIAKAIRIALPIFAVLTTAVAVAAFVFYANPIIAGAFAVMALAAIVTSVALYFLDKQHINNHTFQPVLRTLTEDNALFNNDEFLLGENTISIGPDIDISRQFWNNDLHRMIVQHNGHQLLDNKIGEEGAKKIMGEFLFANRDLTLQLALGTHVMTQQSISCFSRGVKKNELDSQYSKLISHFLESYPSFVSSVGYTSHTLKDLFPFMSATSGVPYISNIVTAGSKLLRIENSYPLPFLDVEQSEYINLKIDLMVVYDFENNRIVVKMNKPTHNV